jgi:hypothetical protein
VPIPFLPDEQLITAEPPALERHKNAYATPFARDGNVVTGAVYSSGGSLIRLSQRFSGQLGDRVTLADPDSVEVPSTAERVEGRGLYIGSIFNHWGIPRSFRRNPAG